MKCGMVLKRLAVSLVLPVGLSLVLLDLAQAGPRGERARVRHMEGRNERQQERISEGVESGQLTRKEARKLEKEERRVDRMEERALRDGNVSPKEAARINRAQDKVSADIYRMKHNDRTRPGVTPAVPAQPGGPGQPAQPATPAQPASPASGQPSSH